MAFLGYAIVHSSRAVWTYSKYYISEGLEISSDSLGKIFKSLLK